MKTDFAFLIAAFIGSTVTLIVAIAINATVANEPGNDYGSGTGWALLMPAPAISLLWSLTDILLYTVVGFYHPVYWLTTTTILLSLNAVLGSMGVSFWYWSSKFAWGAGMFTAILAPLYFVSMIFAAMAVHKWRQQKKVEVKEKDVESEL